MGAGEGEVVVDVHASDPGGPLVVHLHGGGWAAGSRRDHPERFRGLADRGLTVASVDYRTVAHAPYPAPRDDVAAVVDVLRTELPSAGVDPSGVVLMGASAGAHLAAMIAFGGSFACRGLVGLFGRYDLRSVAGALRPALGLVVPEEIRATAFPPGLEQPERRIAALAGLAPDRLSDGVLARLSPVVALTSAGPPMLLVHGTADAVVDHRHSERLAERAEELGVSCELLLVDGANHEDPAFAGDAVLDAVATFVHASSR